MQFPLVPEPPGHVPVPVVEQVVKDFAKAWLDTNAGATATATAIITLVTAIPNANFAFNCNE